MLMCRMADEVQPYHFEPLITAEESLSYRKRVISMCKEDSNDEEEERSEDSRKSTTVAGACVEVA